jgi:hypothetical protein
VSLDQELQPVVPEEKQQKNSPEYPSEYDPAEKPAANTPAPSPTQVAEASASTPLSGALSSLDDSRSSPNTLINQSEASKNIAPARSTPKTEPAPPEKPGGSGSGSTGGGLEPSPNGAWAVQIGAFANQENALNLAAKLKEAGFAPQVRAANTSSGQLMHKVWIGYFQSREDAASYARQNRRALGEGIPVHR